MYAKFLGSYEILNKGGNPRNAFDTLLGTPTTSYWFGAMDYYSDYNECYTPEDIYSILRDCSDNNYPSVASIYNPEGAYNLPG